jgi:hypothetical protein
VRPDLERGRFHGPVAPTAFAPVRANSGYASRQKFNLQIRSVNSAVVGLVWFLCTMVTFAFSAALGSELPANAPADRNKIVRIMTLVKVFISHSRYGYALNLKTFVAQSAGTKPE